MTIKMIKGAALLACFATSGALAKENYGWVENGIVMPAGVMVKMKLDTGALTSSIDARSIRYFKREGKPWVSFDLNLTDAKTQRHVISHLERPVERSVTIRGAGGEEQRPTVTLAVCVGNQVYQEWFTLRDRSEMIYPVLLGRRLLEQLGPVDASTTFTHQPQC